MQIVYRLLIILALFSATSISVHASVQDDIAAKNQQIEELRRQIAEFQAQADTFGVQSKTLEREVAKLNNQISQITLEVKSLATSIDRTTLELEQTSETIRSTEERLILYEKTLAQYVKATNATDKETLPTILLSHTSLSDFFNYTYAIEKGQERFSSLLQELKLTKQSLDSHQEELQEKKSELAKLKALQELQQRQLAGAKQEKTVVLRDTKGQESKFQELVKKRTQDLKKLQEQITYLNQSGITVQDAVKYAQLAALGAGIRPAFLLALLETESRLGLNVGSGNWQDDMVQCYLRLAGIAKTQERKAFYQKRAASEESAFLAITRELGVDPNSVKVSREPSYGCGGAMGPAQFIPTTWLGYASAVKTQTGRSIANPWNTEDAFTAAAIKLARGGAAKQTRSGELAAAKAYISGNPNCTQAICNSYSSTILKKADAIEINL